MSQPIASLNVKPAPAPPAAPPVKQTPHNRHPIKPITVSGESYTAASFGASFRMDTDGRLSELKIRFYDTAGKLLPPDAIRPIKGASKNAIASALASITSAGATSIGETQPQIALRAVAAYVAAVYGVSLT